MKVGRFIHTLLDDNQLPTRWKDPGSETLHEGCQVLDPHLLLTIHQQGEHDLDDWYRGGDSYTRITLIEVSGKSGERGNTRTYPVISEDDVEEMRVMDVGSLDWEMTDIWEEMLDEGYDLPETQMGFPGERWWTGHEDEVIDRLFDRMKSVEPEFVDTLD